LATTAQNPAIPDDASDTILEFPDNRLLIDLCGELDRNIAQVESRMGVTIHRRGNHLTLQGPEPDRAAAETVLRALYERLEQGRPLSPGDIEAAIRLGPSPAPAPGPTPPKAAAAAKAGPIVVDDSLQVYDAKLRIYGVVVLSQRLGAVLQLTCGADLCKSEEGAGRLMTRILGRL